MKISYDPRTDTLSVILREGVVITESDEERPGVILDFDEQGNLVSLDVLDASTRVTDARRVDYELCG